MMRDRVIYFFNDFLPHYYRILAIIGVLFDKFMFTFPKFTANVVAFVTLLRGRCRLSKVVTSYLVAMAVADLLVVIFRVILQRVFGFYYSPECNVVDTIGYISVSCSVWLTVGFTLDRTVAICFQRLKTRYCTEKGAAIVIAVVSLLSVLTNIPWYFKYQPYFCVISYWFITSPVWQQFDWGHGFLTPIVPFVLILLLNAVTVRHILKASAVRRRLRGQQSGEKKDDPEMKNRKRSIILLFAISTSFVLFWIVRVFSLAVQRITGQYVGIPFDYVVVDTIGTMFQLFSSCTNMFIYAITQRKFREEMINVMKYPFVVIRNVIKS
ncbi:probable G-protein coupled receptor 139 [Mobula hypostoma]|uniref:probable G-protein coupled receptor 139 n=1 Tax=Mobula hypostoma TaxID=723540 RepID=UPI002FC2E768